MASVQVERKMPKAREDRTVPRIQEEPVMACEVCGNEYDKMMEIRLQDRKGVFDCFECAIHAMAPRCEHCGCRIIGHGVEAAGRIFCCASCARMVGVEQVRA